MPKRAPRLRLSWIPTCPVHSQAISPSRRFCDEKHHALVTRSAAHPSAAVTTNRTTRLRGTALGVIDDDDAGAESAFMLTVKSISPPIDGRRGGRKLARDSLAVVFLPFRTLDADRSI